MELLLYKEILNKDIKQLLYEYIQEKLEVEKNKVILEKKQKMEKETSDKLKHLKNKVTK